jgi:hypothetical protein
MLKRETELRAAINKRFSDLEEYVEARREGVPMELADETAENILRTRIAIDQRELDASIQSRHRKPWLIGAAGAGALGVLAGVALGRADLS